MYNFINEARKEKLLRNTKFVKGVLESEDHSSLKFNDGVFTRFAAVVLLRKY
jgi:hypothetical protein